MLGIIILCIGILVVLFSSFMLYRNEQVNKYRGELIKTIADKGLEEINLHIFGLYQQRWDLFDTVSYDSMMLHFWKPVDSFYNHIDWDLARIKEDVDG